MAGRSPLIPIVRKFFENDPETATHSLEVLDEKEALSVLKSLPPTLAAQVFPRLNTLLASNLLKEVTPETFKLIVEKLEPQQGAAIFVNLPQEIRDNYIQNLSDKTKNRILELLTYPENSAGRIMSSDFVAFHTDIKGKEAIQKIRLLARSKGISSYLYVIDTDNKLVGILNMRDLLLAGGDMKLSEIMRPDVFCVDAFMDREEIANQLSTRKYFAVPVVDSAHRIIGIVKAEQIIAHVQAEASEDILKMFGAGGDERTFSTVGFAIRKRLGWLYVNLATAFLASSVVGLFEDTISKITILAVFMPVVAGQGGNAGSQSLAVVMRGIVMREIPKEKIWHLIGKETMVGTLNGFLIGSVTALAAWMWHGNPWLGLVIGLAMIVNLFAAGLSGAAIPLIMKELGFDPAQSSGIILTTVTDVVGFSSFLGFAVMFQRFLL